LRPTSSFRACRGVVSCCLRFGTLHDHGAHEFPAPWVRAIPELVEPKAYGLRRGVIPVKAGHRVVALGENAVAVDGLDLLVIREGRGDRGIELEAPNPLGRHAEERAVPLFPRCLLCIPALSLRKVAVDLQDEDPSIVAPHRAHALHRDPLAVALRRAELAFPPPLADELVRRWMKHQEHLMRCPRQRLLLGPTVQLAGSPVPEDDPSANLPDEDGIGHLPHQLHYLRWVLFNIGPDTYFMYQGIFDTDFDKYTEDAVALFTKTGINTSFEKLEGFPKDWKTNVPAFIAFLRQHQHPSFLEYGEYPYVTATEIKKALELRSAFSKMLDEVQ
jgi:hypothetical protein